MGDRSNVQGSSTVVALDSGGGHGGPDVLAIDAEEGSAPAAAEADGTAPPSKAAVHSLLSQLSDREFPERLEALLEGISPGELIQKLKAAPEGHATACLSQIERDVPRTCTQRWMTKRRREEFEEQLSFLLLVYAGMDPELGYCQGMGDLLAAYLIGPKHTVNRGFSKFLKLMASARQNFLHGFSSILQQQRAAVRVIRDHEPLVHSHLKNIGGGEGHWAFQMLLLQMARHVDEGALESFWRELERSKELRPEQELMPYVVAALIIEHRAGVLRCGDEFELLYLCNQRLLQVHVQSLLLKAELLVEKDLRRAQGIDTQSAKPKGGGWVSKTLAALEPVLLTWGLFDESNGALAFDQFDGFGCDGGELLGLDRTPGLTMNVQQSLTTRRRSSTL